MYVSVILLKCNGVFSYSMFCFGQNHLLNTKKITVILQGVFSDLCAAGRSMDDNWGLRVAHDEQSPDDDELYKFIRSIIFDYLSGAYQSHPHVTMTSLLEPEFQTGYQLPWGRWYKITYRATCSQVVVRATLTDWMTFLSKKRKKKT